MKPTIALVAASVLATWLAGPLPAVGQRIHREVEAEGRGGILHGRGLGNDELLVARRAPADHVDRAV
ncbi:MAG: hypothetical protein ACYTE6_07580, partial [Planctomycetota bacterium]